MIPPDRTELILATILAALTLLTLATIARGIVDIRRARDCSAHCHPFVAKPSSDGCLCVRSLPGVRL